MEVTVYEDDAPAPAKPTPRAGQVWRWTDSGSEWTLEKRDNSGWRVSSGSQTSWASDASFGSATLIRDVEEKAPECASDAGIALQYAYAQQYFNSAASQVAQAQARASLNATAADQAREESQRRRTEDFKAAIADTKRRMDAEVAKDMEAIDKAYAESEKQRRDKEAIAAKWEQERATMLWGRSPFVSGYDRKVRR